MSEPLAIYTCFDGTVPVGEIQHERGVWKGINHLPSWAFFCPRCGEIWGRVVRTSPAENQHWLVMQRPCVAHGDGQMLVGQDLNRCSQALLQRELLAILERYPNV